MNILQLPNGKTHRWTNKGGQGWRPKTGNFIFLLFTIAVIIIYYVNNIILYYI